jgi:chromate transport protein ChrA
MRGLSSLPKLLAFSAVALMAAAFSAGCGSGGSGGSGGADAIGSASGTEPLRVHAETSPDRLPAPLSGEAAVTHGGRMLIIGGVDSSDASTSSVFAFDPSSGRAASAGSLSQPLHDAAAVALPTGTLVFGGGSASTTDEVQRLRPGGTAAAIGRLPKPNSDLSAVRVGPEAVVFGGYDGAEPLDSVLRTADGSRLTTVAQLPVAVRYASVAADGSRVYVLGGELASGLDSSQIQAVDLAKGTAAAVGHLPGPLSHASTVVLGGRTYILGGRLAGHTTDQILRFDPASVRANLAGHLPRPIQNAAAATAGGVGYLFGGLDPQGTTLSSIVTMKLMPPAGGAAAE